MPLVFVHGVSVRKDATYESALAARNRFFCEVMLAGADGRPYANPVVSPYWGDHGVRFRFNMASLPNFDINRYVPMGMVDTPFGGEVPLTGGENDADNYLAQLPRLRCLRPPTCCSPPRSSSTCARTRNHPRAC